MRFSHLTLLSIYQKKGLVYAVKCNQYIAMNLETVEYYSRTKQVPFVVCVSDGSCITQVQFDDVTYRYIVSTSFVSQRTSAKERIRWRVIHCPLPHLLLEEGIGYGQLCDFSDGRLKTIDA